MKRKKRISIGVKSSRSTFVEIKVIPHTRMLTEAAICPLILFFVSISIEDRLSQGGGNCKEPCVLYCRKVLNNKLNCCLLYTDLKNGHNISEKFLII